MILSLATGSFWLAFLLALGLNWLALIPWRRSAGKHWTERARQLYPAQKSARLNNWLIPVNLVVLGYALFPDVNFSFTAIPGFLGALLAGYFFSHEIFPDLKFKFWLHLVIAGLSLFFGWWLLLIIAIFEMPDNFGPLTWLIAAGVFILFLAYNLGLGLVLLRWFRLLQPASEHLNSLIAAVSAKMGVPVRASWIFSTHVSNAVAFPLTRQLVFTQKLLSTLSDDEIKAVCAHELGHLNEPRKVLFVRVLVSFALFPLIFSRPMSSLGENGGIAVYIIVIGTLITWVLGVRLFKRMEKRADKIAAESLTDMAVYARSLERIYEANKVPAVMSRRSHKIHPDLYDRMMAAGVTPDFPKPIASKGQCWTSILMLVCIFVIPIAAVFIKAFIAAFEDAIVHIH